MTGLLRSVFRRYLNPWWDEEESAADWWYRRFGAALHERDDVQARLDTALSLLSPEARAVYEERTAEGVRR